MVNTLRRKRQRKKELPIFAPAIKLKKAHRNINTDIAITVVHLASIVSEKDGKCRNLDAREIV